MLVRHITKNIAILAVAATASFGATPVARVIGAQPVDIDGITAPQGNYAPVSPGSEIRTRAGRAVLQFRDGSNVALEPNSAVRVEGQASALQVRIVRGMATYTISWKSNLKVVDSRGATLNRILDQTLAQPALMSPDKNNLALGAAAIYRGNNRQPGGIAPMVAIATGQFTGSGTFHAASATSQPSIVTPNGLKINLNVTLVNNEPVYTIASITQTVTLPSGGTTEVSLPPSSNGLTFVGATVNFSGSNQNGSSVQNIEITPPGSSTPVSPSSVSTALQQGVTTAVQTGIQSGTLPANTAPPSSSPVLTGKFSASAP